MNEKILAGDAHSVIHNPAFKSALERLEAALDKRILNANTMDQELCTNIVMTKQLLKAFERELHRFIEDSQVIDFEEQRKVNKKTEFRR